MSTLTQTARLEFSPPASPAASSSEKASTTAWITVLAGMIGAFMAILNIQITNASLLDIEGGIGTGVDNGAWISTSYLIGEIVVIPLTDYLSRVFSFRRYMLANVVLFALFSRYVSAQYMFWTVSGEGVIWTIVGGAGTLIGPPLGALLLIVLREELSIYWEHYLLLVGAVVILVVTWAPHGIMGLLRKWTTGR